MSDVETIVKNRVGDKQNEYANALAKAAKEMKGIRKRQVDLYVGRKIYDKIVADSGLDVKSLPV